LISQSPSKQAPAYPEKLSLSALQTTTVIRQCHTLLKYCNSHLLQIPEGSYRKATVHYTITLVILEAPPVAYFDMMMKFLFLQEEENKSKKFHLNLITATVFGMPSMTCFLGTKGDMMPALGLLVTRFDTPQLFHMVLFQKCCVQVYLLGQ
jgi:hypothetical protein